MNKVDQLSAIYAVFKIGDSVFINDGKFLIGKNKKQRIDTLNSYRYSNGYIGIISKGEIRIYDEELKLLTRVVDKDIDFETSGVEIFSDDAYVVFKTVDVTNALIFINNKKAGEAKNFWGRFLNASYRLNFKEDTFDRPSYFRCSDLLDTKTYFEFQCHANEKVIDNFYVWRQKLIFPLVRNNQLYLVMLNIQTGVIEWEVKIVNPNFMIDKRGLMVSVWGSDGSYPETPRQYQMISLENRSVDIGVPKGSGPFYNVSTPQHLQLLQGDKLYFSDNRNSFSGEKPNPVRVGCFDTGSKTVEFLYEITESPLSPISEIIESDGKLYLRNANNELFIFTLDNE